MSSLTCKADNLSKLEVGWVHLNDEIGLYQRSGEWHDVLRTVYKIISLYEKIKSLVVQIPTKICISTLLTIRGNGSAIIKKKSIVKAKIYTPIQFSNY